MPALYNEIEPFACEWLENLERAGHIAPGRVERRSIRDLLAADVAGAGQRHFFAGIGAWSHALRLAGWPDDLDVWTGSCPCQPFSSAGRRAGTDDDRHLWPEWFRLIRECRPAVVLGEQVASRDALPWLDLVRSDLEGAGYAFGAADLCAAGVGAPHIRQRFYFVAIADGLEGRLQLSRGPARREDAQAGRGSKAGDCACWDPNCFHRKYGHPLSRGERCADGTVADDAERRRGQGCSSERVEAGSDGARSAHGGFMGGASGAGLAGRAGEPGDDGAQQPPSERAGGAVGGFWADADWIPCRDGFLRPVEPGTFPLAHGAPSRVGRLRAYGNAIVPEVAAVFIRTVIEWLSTPVMPL